MKRVAIFSRPSAGSFGMLTASWIFRGPHSIGPALEMTVPILRIYRPQPSLSTFYQSPESAISRAAPSRLQNRLPSPLPQHCGKTSAFCASAARPLQRIAHSAATLAISATLSGGIGLLVPQRKRGFQGTAPTGIAPAVLNCPVGPEQKVCTSPPLADRLAERHRLRP